MEMQKQLHYILFRLFWDDKPIGFQYWDPETGDSYTHGEPEKINGHDGWGWCGTKISHNRKEILDIHYVDEEYLKERKDRIDMAKSIFENMKKNQDIINFVRETNNLEPINIR